jgi:hypothetical protein
VRGSRSAGQESSRFRPGIRAPRSATAAPVSRTTYGRESSIRSSPPRPFRPRAGALGGVRDRQAGGGSLGLQAGTWHQRDLSPRWRRSKPWAGPPRWPGGLRPFARGGRPHFPRSGETGTLTSAGFRVLDAEDAEALRVVDGHQDRSARWSARVVLRGGRPGAAGRAQRPEAGSRAAQAAFRKGPAGSCRRLW